jgi:hypothetical protein
VPERMRTRTQGSARGKMPRWSSDCSRNCLRGSATFVTSSCGGTNGLVRTGESLASAQHDVTVL